MHQILQPKVAFSQQLKRASHTSTIQPMVAFDRESEFFERLNAALDYAGFPEGRQRRSSVAKEFKVSIETARKWLVGETMPKATRLFDEIAPRLNVLGEWLATGAPPMLPTRQATVDAPEDGDTVQASANNGLSPLEQQLIDEFRNGSEQDKSAVLEFLEFRLQKARERTKE